MRKTSPLITVLLAALCVALACPRLFAQEEKRSPLEQPVIVNGDTVEYVTERSEITATGNVKVDYKGTKLTCKKLTVNTVTKDAVAEGLVVIEDPNGTMRGERIIYNFNTKKGSVINGKASAPPYFCDSDLIVMKNDREFSAQNAFTTTCSFDHPHYGIRTGRVDAVRGESVRTRSNTLTIGDTPCFWLPYYSQGLSDTVMNFSLQPGYRRDWGPFALTSYKYYLNEMVTGKLYLDYRERLGIAEGVGANYRTPQTGSGDAKVYYTGERPSTKEGGPGEFERWFARWRHRWDIDENTDVMVEYYRVSDEKRAELGPDWNFLRDYFPREYEKDTQPPSYALFHRSFNTASLDVSAQTRSWKWYDHVDRVPEARYSLPDLLVNDSVTPVYFQDTTQLAYLEKKVTSPALPGQQYSATRFDTYNQVSAPFKAAFLEITPFTAMRNTAYSAGAMGDEVDPRAVFYAGTSASTRFYRTYGTGPHFLGMDIQDIRHIIAPTVEYTYNAPPSVPSAKLRQFDEIDAIGEKSAFGLGLVNRLQTKRRGLPVELMNLRVTNDYILHSHDPLDPDEVTNNRFSDIIRTEMEFYPYSWMSFIADADYNHHGGYFSTANYDLSFTVEPGRRFGFGQRFQRKNSDELTAGLDWRLTPKWSFHTYNRYQIRDNAPEPQGMTYQEYGFTRDLHCWLMDLSYSYEKEHGHSVWIVFRLKAFPEAEVSLSQSYSTPHAGSK